MSILFFQEFVEIIDQPMGLCDLILFEKFSQCAPQRLSAADASDPPPSEKADRFRVFQD
jgi:hypothetical protein